MKVEKRAVSRTPAIPMTRSRGRPETLFATWHIASRGFETTMMTAPGDWAIGAPEEVLTSETLSQLYGTDVDVLRVRGRVVVVGTPDDQHVHHVDHDH